MVLRSLSRYCRTSRTPAARASSISWAWRRCSAALATLPTPAARWAHGAADSGSCSASRRGSTADDAAHLAGCFALRLSALCLHEPLRLRVLHQLVGRRCICLALAPPPPCLPEHPSPSPPPPLQFFNMFNLGKTPESMQVRTHRRSSSSTERRQLAAGSHVSQRQPCGQQRRSAALQ